MALSVEEINDLQVLAEYKAQWDALSRESRDADLFHSYNWITTWIDAFWKDKPIAFMLVRDDIGQLVGLAPLVSDDHGLLCCRGSLAAPVNDYSTRTSIVAGDDSERVTCSVLEHLRKSQRSFRLVFRDVRADSWVAQELPRYVDEFKLSAAVVARSASPYIDLTCGMKRYYQNRSSRFRHETGRKLRRIQKAGHVECVTVASVESVARTMPDVLQIEKNSWKHQTGSAFTSQEALTNFYETFSHRSAAEKEFRLHLLYLDRTPIAHIYGTVFKNTYYALKTSYDSRYQTLSPGSVLFGHALEDSFEQGFDRLDLLGEESKWKNELATGTQPQVDVCLFPNNRIRCRMCRQFEQTVKPFLERNISQTDVYCRVKRFLRKYAPASIGMKRGLSERMRRWLR